MKKIISVLLVIIAVFLVSCSDTESFVTTDYSVDAFADAIPDGIVYQNGSERELDGDFLDYYFGNKDLLLEVDSYVFITSPTTSVNEAGVFKITSESARDTLIKAFETRRGNLIQTYTNYSAEDLAISEGMTIGSFDDIVYFIATPDNASIEALIKK